MERRMKKSPAEKDVMRAENQASAATGACLLYATTSAAVPDFAALRSWLFQLDVIPGRAKARTRNLEIPGLVLRTIPE
jgi:hypothetical protein